MIKVTWWRCPKCQAQHGTPYRKPREVCRNCGTKMKRKKLKNLLKYARVSRLPPKKCQGNWMMRVRVPLRVRG
jgi:hypothetical protein